METENHPKKSRNPFSMEKAHKNTSNLSQFLARKTNLIQWTTRWNYKLRATVANSVYSRGKARWKFNGHIRTFVFRPFIHFLYPFHALFSASTFSAKTTQWALISYWAVHLPLAMKGHFPSHTTFEVSFRNIDVDYRVLIPFASLMGTSSSFLYQGRTSVYADELLRQE